MTDMSIRTARPVTLKRPRPNPVFQEWLEELLVEAKQKKCKLEHQLTEALISLSKYPLPLNSAAECKILKGFDSRLCKFIEQRLSHDQLTSHKLQNRIEIEDVGHHGTVSAHSSHASSSENDLVLYSVKHSNNHCNSPRKEQRNDGVPKLKESDDIEYLNTTKIVSESSYINISENDFATNKLKCKKYMTHLITYLSIFKALKQLNGEVNSLDMVTSCAVKEVELISERLITSKLCLPICPRTYRPFKEFFGINQTKKCYLTSKGLSEAEYFNNLFENQVNHLANNKTTTMSSDLTLTEVVNTVQMKAGCYDIILLIDKNETSGSTNKNDPTVAQFKRYSELKHEYRSLKVGDFAWIARHKVHEDQELVLPFIVERKRLDDLSASIKDGRFHEQKFRLRRCGLENVIYMVESYASKKHVGLPVQTLMQALANTRVQDRFKVHMTDSLSNSARFLAMMTKRLTIGYRDKTLKGRNAEPDKDFLMTFEFFNKMSVKNKPLSVTETFIKLLLQLKGLSVEKALAITKVYRTPKSLIHAYENLEKEDGEILLANLKYGELDRKVGPVVSKSIYQLFSSYDIR